MLASGSHLPSRSFGLAGVPSRSTTAPDADDMIADPMACRTCGRQLCYAWRSIGHLGDFACPAATSPGHPGRRDRVAPATHGGAAPERRHDDDAPAQRTVGWRDRAPGLLGLPMPTTSPPPWPLGRVAGHTVEQSATAIEGYAGSFGRLEWMDHRRSSRRLVLVKNTVSLAETVHLGPSLAADVVLLGLNDAPADGRDVSWIWDAPIAPLVAGRAVVLTGSRSRGSRSCASGTSRR